MSSPQNLEAMRALFAFNSAEKGNKKQKDTNNKFNYSAAVQELPSMLRMNGLRATMAYYYSKDKEGGGQHRFVFKQILNWFKNEKEPTKFMNAKFNEQKGEKTEVFFMEVLLKLSDDEYRIVQAETLNLANWMIRFVKTENAESQTETSHDTEQSEA
ncbi:MAG: type III-B CRISPR module-associated protein Cmr5 [Saprospiraceae bacterium]